MSVEVNIKKTLPAFDLEVELEAGNETLGLLGASGCGKSLTLRCIAGVETPDEGRIVVNDRVFFDSKEGIDLTPQERKTALLFQNYQLFPNMTVAENVAAGMDPKMDPAERDSLVSKYLSLFSLQGFEKRYPLRLSGGQQQRVALARMLAARPGILMLDEPFSALDSFLKDTLQQSLLDLFELYEGTILYVSHDIDEAFRFCDRIAVIESGHIAEVGRTHKILHHPATLATLKLSGCKNISRFEMLEENEVLATDWGMTFSLPPDFEIPVDATHLGIRAMFIREADPGETGKNLYALHVHRASDTRFERAVILDTPGGNPHERIYLRIPKKGRTRESLPKSGDTLNLHFDAREILFVRS
ncbi:MAG: sulfate/molybdate ABC transporter ATP-binding protein [Coriobacteriales bacterium]|jgi:molybdate transport system ATP-binding protein